MKSEAGPMRKLALTAVGLRAWRAHGRLAVEGLKGKLPVT